jgi:hypothetical protein
VEDLSASTWLLLARVSIPLSCSEQLRQPGEIVARHREGEVRTDPLGAALAVVWAIGPTVLPQPKTSSIRLRMRWLTA